MKFFVTLLSFIACSSFALAAYGLTDTDLAIVSKLSDIAVQNSSAVLTARQALETAKQAESIGGQILKNLNVNINVSTGNALPFDQITPSLSISAGLNVTNLINQQPSQVPALAAKVAELEDATRLQVLKTYSTWRLARSKAQTAADTLDLRVSDYKTMQARVKAGTATQTDLLRALEAVNTASDALEAANHQIVITKSELAAVVRISLEELQKVLIGATK